MPTIQDVAKRAGVGAITVSRVINNSGYASQKTRERVEAAIAELGYVPNTLARSLRSKRTNTLALILTDITNPYFTTLARGVEDTANQAGYTVIFCNTDESEEKEQHYLDVLLQKQVDGFLLVPAQSNPGSILSIQKHGTQVVALDRRIPDVGVDIVRCDADEGAYQLTKYLISLGHRQVVMLTGPEGVSTADDRAVGFQRAMAELDNEFEAAQILRGDFTQESGYQMGQKAIRLHPRPTAVIAANNFITIGAMKALQETGLEVPEDIALAGFDDLPTSMVTFPFFTVVSQPAYEMGCVATQRLLSRLGKQPPDDFTEIILPTELIVRRSSGSAIA